MPVISVVLPAYNVEKYIAEAVQSILDQTFADFEFIIINDASTDKTFEIINSFPDPRIRVVTNEINLGLVKSLNKGLDMAQGEFIARMDGDDISYPERFKKQITFLRKHSHIEVCGTWANIFGFHNFTRKLSLKHDDIKAQLLFLNRIVHPTLMIRRQSFLKYNIRFDEKYIKCEDYGLWVDIIDKVKFATIPEVLLDYRSHSANFSIPNETNWELLKKWNCIIYRTIFDKLKVDYNEGEVLMQLHLAFWMTKKISKTGFQNYMNWFGKILLANKKSNYFKHKSLKKEIGLQILFLGTKKEDTSRGSYYDIIFKTLLKNGLLFHFISLRTGFIVDSIFGKQNKTIDETEVSSFNLS